MKDDKIKEGTFAELSDQQLESAVGGLGIVASFSEINNQQKNKKQKPKKIKKIAQSFPPKTSTLLGMLAY